MTPFNDVKYRNEIKKVIPEIKRNLDNRSSSIVLNPFHLNWHFPHHSYCGKMFTIISLGQFLWENVCIAQTKNGPHLKLGQLLWRLWEHLFMEIFTKEKC
ncbi:hypothetical protein Lal_00033646 [Lupinus albus]|nr:hypothetical protein Lal_00033646 [Lupinus albus]